MSLRVREWLPAEAAGSAAAHRLVREAVALWGPKWFARAETRAAGFETRTDAAARRPGGWRTAGAVAVSLAGSETVRLAGLALGAEPERLVLSETDRDLIGGFTAAIADDLAATIEAALGLGPAEAEAQIAVEDPFAGDGGLLFAVNDRDERPLLQVAIPAAALVPFLKAAIAPARRRGAPLARLGGAFESTAVRIEARLGAVTLPLGDLAGLAAGDVLILDRAVEDGAELALRPSGRPFAQAAITPGDSKLSLLLFTQQRDS
jgi:hypothetical protein